MSIEQGFERAEQLVLCEAAGGGCTGQYARARPLSTAACRWAANAAGKRQQLDRGETRQAPAAGGRDGCRHAPQAGVRPMTTGAFRRRERRSLSAVESDDSVARGTPEAPHA